MDFSIRGNFLAFLLFTLVCGSLAYLFLFVLAKSPEIVLMVLLVISVIALVLTLSLAAFTFKTLDLSDETQALGLPEGSIRAVIALSLILIFMISSLFLFQQVNTHENGITIYKGITQEQLNDIPKGEIAYIQRNGTVGNETLFDAGRIVERSKASEDIAKQIITTVSTLVVAVAGFYFGSKTAAAPSRAPATSVPVIRRVDPDAGKQGEDIDFKIIGKNFELAKEVKLIHESNEIQCTGITPSSTMIKCKLKIPTDPKEAPEGKWTVVVINSDKGEDRLEGAFTVSAP